MVLITPDANEAVNVKCSFSLALYETLVSFLSSDDLFQLLSKIVTPAVA